MKRCVTCLETKAYGFFYKRASAKDGHGSQCKDCQRVYLREWKRVNTDKTAASWRRYYAKHADKHLAKNAKWRDENKELQRQLVKDWEKRNPDRVAAKTRRYRERHPEQFKKWQNARRDSGRRRIANWTRRAKIANQSIAGCDLTPEAIRGRFEMFGWRCRFCKKPLTAKTCEADHRIPISRGGLNCPANIVPICRICNVTKSDKTEAEFLARLQLRTAETVQPTVAGHFQ